MFIPKIIAIIAVLSVIISTQGYSNMLQSRNSAPSPINNNSINNMQYIPKQDTAKHRGKKQKPNPDSNKSKPNNKINKKMHPADTAMPRKDTV